MTKCEECDGLGVVDCSHCGTPEAEECTECLGTGQVEDYDEDYDLEDDDE